MTDTFPKPHPGESIQSYMNRVFESEMPKLYQDFYDQQETLLLHGRNDPRLTPEFLAEYDQTPTLINRYMHDDWD
jgi:hypothetical protein